jgi:hypothetical protein
MQSSISTNLVWEILRQNSEILAKSSPDVVAKNAKEID